MATNHVIIVPVTASPASLDAVTLACVLGKQRKSKVYAVHVIEVLRSLPLSAELETDARRGEQVLRRAEEIASAAGFHIEGELLQAREAGQAIVDEVRDRSADTVVLGVGAERLLGDFSMGRTAEFVLRHSLAEVIVVRHSAATKHDDEHEHD